MYTISSYATVGISAPMIFPKSFEDDLWHLHAVNTICRMSQFDAIEGFLPEDDNIRAQEVRLIRESGKQFNYNFPLPLQQDGPCNPCSEDPAVRTAGLLLAKTHLDYAGELGAGIVVVASAPDKGESVRTELKKRFADFYLQIAEYAKRYNIILALEPIERHRFKKLLMGPTEECANFIIDMQKQGCCNAKLILDICHLPLMEEELGTALSLSMPVGLAHIHMADAVLEPGNEFYGHTHPPIGVQGGSFDLKELTEQFHQLFVYGYLTLNPPKNKPLISLEVRPYPGVSSETSAIAQFEKLEQSFKRAVELVLAG